MGNTLCVLDTTSEEVRAVIRHWLGRDYDLRFAQSYDRAEQMELAAAADYIWVGWPPVDAAMIEAAPRLKVVHKCGMGVDGIDLDAARARGVRVFITNGVNAVPVAEMALLMIMVLFRALPLADRSMRDGRWLKTEMRGRAHHLTGKTVGIVGMGNIGRSLARLLKGFDCSILYYDVERLPHEQEAALGLEHAALADLVASSDAVSLHMPLTPDTRGLFDYRMFASMKREAVFVNCSRGELAVEADLVRALGEGLILGAGLDVFEREPLDPDSPLLPLDNVVLTPHVAGSTINNMQLRAERIRNNLAAFASGCAIAPADIIV